MIPHRCPVCEGRGKVLASFYGESINTSSNLTVCKSCYGTGIIWEITFGSPYPYIPPTITPINPAPYDPINPWGPWNPDNGPSYTASYCYEHSHN